MDTYSILDKNSSQAAPGIASSRTVPSNSAVTSSGAAAAPAMARETLRFPGEDGGKSLSEMAQRDLDATLQLLAERAQYITGASGVAIALREGENMVCCASAGPSAPDMGTHLQIDSGLSAESVRTRKTLHCDDAENDPRVNRESCRAFGIASVVVMPLVRDDEVYGVFELLAGRPRAFEERDFTALQRLSEMIQTALELAEAARRAEKELGSNPETATATKAGTTSTSAALHSVAPHPVAPHPVAPHPVGGFATTPAKATPKPEDKIVPVQARVAQAKVIEARTSEATATEVEPKEVNPKEDAGPGPINPSRFGKVRNCEGCGFPISEGRRLCLDCEASSPNVDSASEAPQPFGLLPESEPSWMRSHVYLIATVVLVVATIAVVVWRF
jgi:putative methionine-R-sulfoxide reductase with GAF domain